MNMEVQRLNVVMCMIMVLASVLHVSLAQTTHTVGNGLGWLVPPGGEAAYRTWAASQTFTVGDVLVFNFTTGTHDVAEVSREAYNSCNSTSPISMSTNGPTNITLTSAGEHHFICTFTRHCDLGQRLAINVTASSSPAPAPEPATPPPGAAPETAPSPTVPASPPPSATPAPAPSRAAMMTHVVGDSLGWIVPPGGPIAYQTWARGRTFVVGDTLVFNFTTGVHDVAEVTRAEFNSCNATTNTTVITTGPARVTLTSAGEHYYICTIPRHCSLGQQLAINVTSGGSTAIPPPSSGGPTAQLPGTPPPPLSNSAASFAVAALPFTFLAVALALLYN
ncbi:hypothetical protein RD792_012062 [Penstemon davidsonii]|uniref:Phytocyanin domain-containing protein n=1 Tax=Penstemon davidsonii TaxID=160366 RepID=A0ABR0CXA8_9LAMI|nr:hypothetical protein RD792_012062 [Penstemon davidsonii]